MSNSTNKLPADNIELMRQSGLFDEAYYLDTYGEKIPSGMDALTHFISTGLNSGLKPNPRFDPLIYRILHPEVAPADLAMHILNRYGGEDISSQIEKVLRQVEKTPTFLPVKTHEIDLEISNRESLARANTFADPRNIDFAVEGKQFRIVVPPADRLLNRLRQDRPFALARLSHGDWDDLFVLERYRGRVARAVDGLGMSDKHIDRLAMRLCDRFYPEEGVFAENFLPELLGDLKTHIPHPDLMIGVGFKGYPTADGRLFYRTLVLKPVDIARLRIFADYFDPAEALCDANIFKRWAIAGPLKALPELARERPVILMGADRLASLDKRWNLPWLLHIRMPATRCFDFRQALLAEARETIAEANEITRKHGTKRPVFLLQGSSFAYWMIKRLFEDHPDIFYLDLGLSLHIWFYDREDMPIMPERSLYGHTIIKNCDLEDYYRNLGSILTPELATPAPDA